MILSGLTTGLGNTSTQKPMSVLADDFKLPYSDLKNQCREGNLDPDYAWPRLPGLYDGYSNKPSEHRATNPKSRFNRYFFVKYSCNPDEVEAYSQNESVSDPEEILSLLQQQYVIIEEPSLIIPLLYLLASRIVQAECCYSCMCDVLENCNFYLIPRASVHRARLLVFRNTLAECMPKTFKILIEINALEDTHLNKIFVYFFSGTKALLALYCIVTL